MQAIILAAGMGRRLGPLTRENTKCMIEVNGVRLIDRLLTQLSALNLTRVVMVTGYEGGKLRSYVGESYRGMPIEYIDNPIYDRTNNIYSLSLAREQLQEDDTLLIESDLIFEDSLFRLILDSPHPNAALVDKYKSWMDGTMVRLDAENNIVNFIPKKAFKYSDTDSYYKTVNIYKFSRDFSVNHYVPFLEAYTRALGNNEYYEQVLRVITLIDACDFKALPLDGQKWYEIDDVQDLRIAETLFADAEDKLLKYQRCYGGYWRFPALLDFCYLVNPYFPPQRMVEELKANFETLLREYPSGMGVNSLLGAKYFGLSQPYVCVGNGAAELIKSLMGSIEGPVGVVYPTFEEYPNRRSADGVVPYVPQNPDFAYTADDLMRYYADGRSRRCCSSTPTIRRATSSRAPTCCASRSGAPVGAYAPWWTSRSSISRRRATAIRCSTTPRSKRIPRWWWSRASRNRTACRACAWAWPPRPTARRSNACARTWRSGTSTRSASSTCRSSASTKRTTAAPAANSSRSASASPRPWAGCRSCA